MSARVQRENAEQSEGSEALRDRSLPLSTQPQGSSGARYLTRPPYRPRRSGDEGGNAPGKTTPHDSFDSSFVVCPADRRSAEARLGGTLAGREEVAMSTANAFDKITSRLPGSRVDSRVISAHCRDYFMLQEIEEKCDAQD